MSYSIVVAENLSGLATAVVANDGTQLAPPHVECAGTVGSAPYQAGVIVAGQDIAGLHASYPATASGLAQAQATWPQIPWADMPIFAGMSWT